MKPRPSCSDRALSVQPFHVMELLARARRAEAAGHDIVHMEMGEPDFPAPETIIAAAHKALEQGQTQYSPALGLPELRAAIADYYRRRYQVEVTSDRIIITPGSSGALQLALAALLDVGDEILLPDPTYPCNRQIATVLGIKTVALPVGADGGYQPTATEVAEAWTERTRALMLASPSNPCGSVLGLNEIRRLATVTAARGGHLIMDEIYHGLMYGAEAASALQATDKAFIVNSFSKYFGMTGFRIGWLVVPQTFVPVIERLSQNLFISASTIGQRAALAAFRSDTIQILEERREEFQKRRDFLLPALLQLGFDIPLPPKGAFYIYADASRFTEDAHAFALELLDETGVVITPGIDFGSHNAKHHVRFAYATTLPRLEEGVARLDTYLRARA